MSEIFKYLIKNFSNLKPFDYLLIIISTILLSFGIYLVLKWIYEKIIATQHEVINLKDNIIESNKSYLEKIEKDKEELLKIKNDLLVIAKNNEEMIDDVESQNKYCRLLLCITNLGLNLQRISSNVKRMIMTYMLVPVKTKDSPCPHCLYRDIAKIDDDLGKACDDIEGVSRQIMKGNMRAYLSNKTINAFISKDFFNQLNTIEEKIKQYLDSITLLSDDSDMK